MSDDKPFESLSKSGTHLMWSNPKKYKEMMDNITEEDDKKLSQTIEGIRALSDEEVTFALKVMGSVLREIRIQKGCGLRKFLIDSGAHEKASEIAQIERGMRLPDAKTVLRYKKLLNLG